MATSTSNLFEFDGGDLRISVTYKGDRLAGKVSTSAMMLASPVWKKFIFPPFAQLHEDDEEDDQEYTAVYEGGLVAARKESATDCKGSQKEIAWTQKSPVGCATVWIDHEASYPDETMTEDTDLFDEDLNTTDFQSLENGSIANIDTEKSSAQFQDAQPRTEPNSQSTGTLIGDETLSDEIHGESVAPKAKKRRIAEVPKSKELDFTEDNGEALLILLRIAHLQFHELPEKEMSLDFLLNLAILCDMYDCQKLVKPWVSQWCIFSNLVRPDAALEKLLFVAFVFSKTSIVDLRIKAAKTIAPKPSGGYEFQTKRDAGKPKPIDLNHFPATELDYILLARQKALTNILGTVSEHTELAATARCTHGQVECTELMYGSLSLKLKQLGLGKLPDSIENITKSVENFAEAFTGLPRIPEDRRSKRGGNQSHSSCIGTRFGIPLSDEIDLEVAIMKWNLGHKQERNTRK